MLFAILIHNYIDTVKYFIKHIYHIKTFNILLNIFNVLIKYRYVIDKYIYIFTCKFKYVSVNPALFPPNNPCQFRVFQQGT